MPLRAPVEMRVLKLVTVPGAAMPKRLMFNRPRETGSEHKTDLSPSVLFCLVAPEHTPMSRYTLSVMVERSVAWEDDWEGRGGAGAANVGLSVAMSGAAIVRATRDDLLFMEALQRTGALECDGVL